MSVGMEKVNILLSNLIFETTRCAGQANENGIWESLKVLQNEYPWEWFVITEQFVRQ